MGNGINSNGMLAVGTVLHGTYRIDGYLSSGGFGNTYIATNIQFGVRRAVKEFFMRGVSQRDADSTTVSVGNADNRAMFEQQLEKFKKEARRIFNLNSEHIVRVYDLFEENATAYYVMDFIEGESLSQRMKRANAPLTEDEVWRVVPQILDALEAAHNAGILHLDLKPANIMIDREGIARLIDFGASKQQSLQGGATMSSAIACTPGYAPSEQMEQNAELFGPWTDFYSLGATLYTLLTNQKPSSPSIISEDTTAEKASALPLPASVSPKMRRLIVWLMQVNRRQRPQSVAEIRRFLDNKVHKDAPQEDEATIISKPVTPTKPIAPTTSATPQKNEESNGKPLRAALLVIAVMAVIVIALVAFSGKRSSNAAPTDPSGGNDDIVEFGDYLNGVIEDDTVSVKGVGFVMKGIQGGVFTMGAECTKDNDVDDCEDPPHRVAVSSFRLGQTEVTQALWQAVMGKNPSVFEWPSSPVENITRADAMEFINKLNALTGRQFRLPTEAEWEYAAHGGVKSGGYKYAGSNNVGFVAWYTDNSDNMTHAVKDRVPNELGLYDMCGNVYEMCEDLFDVYTSDSQTNPTGPSSGSLYVIRGGSWNCLAGNVRITHRSYAEAVTHYNELGLRLAE